MKIINKQKILDEKINITAMAEEFLRVFINITLKRVFHRRSEKDTRKYKRNKVS